MTKKKSDKEVPVDRLRWTLNPSELPFKTTEELKPLREIIGQKRGVDAFLFGAGMKKAGYNIFVTGAAGSGRLSTVKKLLNEISMQNGAVPDDLCYVNNFKDNEAPVLLMLKAGEGRKFKKDIGGFIETLKKEAPQLFESQDYINRKKEIMEEYENKGKNFFKELDKRVRAEGFALVDLQIGQIKRPEIMPLVDGNPVHRNLIRYRINTEGFQRTLAFPSSGECFYQFDKGNFPDFVIADCQSLVPEHLSFLKKILRMSPDTKIIFFTDIEDQMVADELLHHGATDYILKSGTNLKGLRELILNLNYLSQKTVHEQTKQNDQVC